MGTARDIQKRTMRDGLPVIAGNLESWVMRVESKSWE
jgi:hypothetical protein